MAELDEDPALAADATCAERQTGAVLKVPFGLSLVDGRMYGPLEVARGKACNCVCPGCQQPLLAKQPISSGRVAHFAHAQGADCAVGLETSVHLAAKQIIEQERALYFPALRPILDIRDALGNPYRKEELLASAGLRPLEDVRLEKAISTLRPDVLATPVGSLHRIAIEIAVTHFVDEAKRDQLKQLRLPALEYDLSACRDLSWDALRDALLKGSVPVRWVYHPQVSDQLKTWKDELAPKLLEAKRQAAEAARAERERLAREREAALAREAEARARRLAEARTLKQQRHQELVKATRFKHATEQVKHARLAKSFGRDEAPRVLRASVAGGKSFGVQDPVLWQGVLFRKLIHGAIQAGHRFVSKDYAVSCLGYRFEIQPQFAEAEKIAVYQYLCHLTEKGALRKGYRQNFEILVVSLEAFELLCAYREGQVGPGRGLQWADDTQWPPTELAHQVAAAHAGPGHTLLFGWAQAAAIIPAIRRTAIRDALAKYAVQASEQALLEYWISTGFIVSKRSPMA